MSIRDQALISTTKRENNVDNSNPPIASLFSDNLPQELGLEIETKRLDQKQINEARPGTTERTKHKIKKTRCHERDDVNVYFIGLNTNKCQDFVDATKRHRSCGLLSIAVIK